MHAPADVLRGPTRDLDPSGWTATLGRAAWLREPRVLLCGGAIVAALLVGLAAPLLAPYDPLQTRPADALAPPSWAHPLGTDPLGRDTLSRVMYGARATIPAALLAAAAGLVGGAALGLASGYAGGALDGVAGRCADALLAFPPLVLALALASALGPSLLAAAVATAAASLPVCYLVARAQALRARDQEYVVAARALGAPPWRVVARHVLPNAAGALTVAGAIAGARGVLMLATLGFLGIGSRPPAPEWGAMVAVAAGYLERAPWLVLGPGLATVLTVLALQQLGDGLRDALDPRGRAPDDADGEPFSEEPTRDRDTASPGLRARERRGHGPPPTATGGEGPPSAPDRPTSTDAAHRGPARWGSREDDGP